MRTLGSMAVGKNSQMEEIRRGILCSLNLFVSWKADTLHMVQITSIVNLPKNLGNFSNI